MITWDIIPGYFAFGDAYKAAIDRAPQEGARFVELGVLFGRSTAFMCQHIALSGKKIEFHAVDSWEGEPEIEILARKWMRGHDVTLHKSRSVPAAEELPGLFDFVWLDAGHTYDEVLADIRAWLPKVKPGGMIGGDDVLWGPEQGYPVRKAVTEAFGMDWTQGSSNGWPSWAFWTVERP